MYKYIGVRGQEPEARIIFRLDAINRDTPHYLIDFRANLMRERFAIDEKANNQNSALPVDANKNGEHSFLR